MKQVLVLSGDGIGPEVTRQGFKAMKVAAEIAGLELSTSDALIGGCAYDEVGAFCPAETIEAARRADVILFGAIGGPQWNHLPKTVDRRGLIRLRKELDLYANLRPARFVPQLGDVSPLRRDIIEGVDMLILRELTGDLYYGEPRGRYEVDGVVAARNTMSYTRPEIERIARMGFELARLRRRRLTSVDKANVLEVSQLWRETVEAIAGDYADVALDHLYVDVAAMEIVRNPRRFDTMVTANLFGDILTDEASVIAGSLGMMPSASLGERHALYEPIHGSAPDIAGQDRANPLGSVLSVAMMFRYSFELPAIDELIQQAVDVTLTRYRTADIAAAGCQTVGCEEMGDRVVEALAQLRENT